MNASHHPSQGTQRQRSRRQLLRCIGAGFPWLALNGLLSASTSTDSGAPRAHFRPRARRVVFLFMGGGPSQVDLLDPKPALERFATVAVEKPHGVGALRDAPQLRAYPSPWKFRQHGESGIATSELLPHLSQCVDDLCVIRSMHCDQLEHSAAIRQLVTGEGLFARPSIGAWLLYGLGTENENLPGFVCMAEQENLSGTAIHAAAFLPAIFQGTHLPSQSLTKGDASPIAYLEPPVPRSVQVEKVRAIAELAGGYRAQRPDDSRLDAQIAAYELAFRMQMASPEAFDLSRETKRTLEMYGLDRPDSNSPDTPSFAKQCLLARRLVERGVRFVMCNVNNRWDSHANLHREHTAIARQTDRPVAALLQDLKQRGLLSDTLVVWTGEFGRTPHSQGSSGRDHHPYGFTAWMAGGGVRGGLTYGATDDFGFYAVEKPVHIHDLHATILHLLGIDHPRLTYRHSGRDFRLTDVYGSVLEDILVYSGDNRV